MITEITIEAIPGRKYSTKVMRDIMQFHESDWSAAEVSSACRRRNTKKR